MSGIPRAWEYDQQIINLTIPALMEIGVSAPERAIGIANAALIRVEELRRRQYKELTGFGYGEQEKKDGHEGNGQPDGMGQTKALRPKVPYVPPEQG